MAAPLFSPRPGRYTPAGAIARADGTLMTWHRAVDAGLIYDRLPTSLHAEGWPAVLLRVRYLVRDCGEDPTDSTAINLCLDALRAQAGLRLRPPN